MDPDFQETIISGHDAATTIDFIPSQDWLAVEEETHPELSEGGIVITEKMRDRPYVGKVVAYGGSEILEHPEHPIGARIVFVPGSGKKIAVSGKETVIVPVEGVLGILLGKTS